MRGPWAAAVALVLGTGGLARAQDHERASSLSWVRLAGAESCPGGPELARAVEERLGRSVFVSTARAELTVEGRAERTTEPAGWRAVLVVSDASGERLGERVVDSRAERCDELARLAAVAIAIMVDPLTAPAERGPERPPPEREVVVVHDRVVVREPAPRWQIGIEGALVGAVGVLPNAAVGGLGTLIVRPPRFVPLLLEGVLLPWSPRQTGYGEVDFLHAHGSALICPLAPEGRRLGLFACAGLGAGAVVITDSAPAGLSGERLVVHAQLAVRGHFRIVGPLQARAGLHLLVPFRHDDLRGTDRDGTAHRLAPASPVSALLTLGLGLAF